MNENTGDDSSFSARHTLGRLRRSDSIPEHSEPAAPSSTTTTTTTTTTIDTTTNDASIEELLMRHSSPLFDRTTVEGEQHGSNRLSSPLAERLSSPQQQRNSSSPSPLRLNRPRSNPRSRTPMRITEHNDHDNENDNDNDNDNGSVSAAAAATESRRITIRLGSGGATGSNTVSYAPRFRRDDHHQHRSSARSNKQGPSHRKARRWNNENFVNLAAELSSTSKSSARAVEALLKGSAEASEHRSIYDPLQHQSKAMKQFREDTTLGAVRDSFFDGYTPPQTATTKFSSTTRKRTTDADALTPIERFHKIETRLRKVVVKACENSYAASKVVSLLEEFFVQVYSSSSSSSSNNSSDRISETTTNELRELLLDTPTVTVPTTTNKKNKNKNNTNDDDDDDDATPGRRNKLIIRFLFDADSPTGGFHRLLLHGVCQFHCLTASSSTSFVHGKKARVLIAKGVFSGDDVRLVDFVVKRQQDKTRGLSGTTAVAPISSPSPPTPSGDDLSNKLSALAV